MNILQDGNTPHSKVPEKWNHITSTQDALAKKTTSILSATDSASTFITQGNNIKKYFLQKFGDDDIYKNNILQLDPEKIGIIFQDVSPQYLETRGWETQHEIQQWEMGYLGRTTKELSKEELLQTYTLFKQLGFPTYIIELYWAYHYCKNKGNTEVLDNFLVQISQFYKKNNEEIYNFIRKNHGIDSIDNTLKCLTEINQKHSIENFINYKNTYQIPFSEQKTLNTANFFLSKWNPEHLSPDEIEIKRKEKQKSVVYFGKEIAQHFNNESLHSYKEMIDVNKIIGSDSRNDNVNWFNEKFGFRDENSIINYTEGILRKSKILKSFLDDPVYVSKIFGPDNNFVYIITQNGNHRTAAAKIAELPAFPAMVQNYKKTEIFIKNNEIREELQEKIEKGLLEGYFKDSIFIMTSSKIPHIELPNNALKRFIEEYEKIYPNAYTPYKDILENLFNGK